jgi:hypothetical protein
MACMSKLSDCIESAVCWIFLLETAKVLFTNSPLMNRDDLLSSFSRSFLSSYQETYPFSSAFLF